GQRRAARDLGDAHALPRPPARKGGARAGRSPRRHRGPGRTAARAGGQVLLRRAHAGDLAAARRADRHALDDVAAPHPRARAHPGDPARDRRAATGPAVPDRAAAGGAAPAETTSLRPAEPSGSAARSAPRTERAGAKRPSEPTSERPSEPTSGGRPSRRAKPQGTEASGEAGPEPPPAPRSTEQSAEPVLGAGTAAVDVAMIRRSWPTLIQHLRSNGKAVL